MNRNLKFLHMTEFFLHDIVRESVTNIRYVKTMTKTNTFRQHLQRAILETCDLWDIWLEWWGDMTWPKKRQWQTQRHLENTFKEQYLRLLNFQTFDVETWNDLQKDKHMKPFGILWPLRYLIRVMRKHNLANKKTIKIHLKSSSRYEGKDKVNDKGNYILKTPYKERF